MVGCWRCTFPSIHLFRLKIAVGCLTSTYPSIHSFTWEETLKITVGCPTRTYPSIRTKKRALTLSRARSVDRRAHVQAFTEKLALTLSRSRSVARAEHMSKNSHKTLRRLLRSRSVDRRATYPSIHLSAGEGHSQDHGRLPALHASMWAEIALCGNQLRPSLPTSPEKQKQHIFFLKNLGILGRTHRTKTSTQENRRVRRQRETM